MTSQMEWRGLQLPPVNSSLVLAISSCGSECVRTLPYADHDHIQPFKVLLLQPTCKQQCLQCRTQKQVGKTNTAYMDHSNKFCIQTFFFVSISPDPLNFCLLFHCTQPKGTSRDIQADDQPLMKISVPAAEIEQLPASTQRCQGQRGLW